MGTTRLIRIARVWFFSFYCLATAAWVTSFVVGSYISLGTGLIGGGGAAFSNGNLFLNWEVPKRISGVSPYNRLGLIPKIYARTEPFLFSCPRLESISWPAMRIPPMPWAVSATHGNGFVRSREQMERENAAFGYQASWAYWSSGTKNIYCREMYVAWGLVLPAFAMLWFLIVKRIRRQRQYVRRLGSGACVCCGYDLRASKDRCPECGTAII